MIPTMSLKLHRKIRALTHKRQRGMMVRLSTRLISLMFQMLMNLSDLTRVTLRAIVVENHIPKLQLMKRPRRTISRISRRFPNESIAGCPTSRTKPENGYEASTEARRSDTNLPTRSPRDDQFTFLRNKTIQSPSNKFTTILHKNPWSRRKHSLMKTIASTMVATQ